MHRPLPSHWSALHALPSSAHAAPLDAGVPLHFPAWQLSDAVQSLPSSQAVPSATGVLAHAPAWQVSGPVQAF